MWSHVTIEKMFVFSREDFLFGQEGISHGEEKVNVIRKFKIPTNVTEV